MESVKPTNSVVLLLSVKVIVEFAVYLEPTNLENHVWCAPQVLVEPLTKLTLALPALQILTMQEHLTCASLAQRILTAKQDQENVTNALPELFVLLKRQPAVHALPANSLIFVEMDVLMPQLEQLP